MSNWMTQLEMTDAERAWLAGVAASEECTPEEYARKTLWQDMRRHLPAAEYRACPSFPPGFGSGGDAG